MKMLSGHVSPETAFVVEDYPYGFRLRCKIRYWLECSPSKGVRFVSQTTNPKVAGERWNKPKASTYCRFGGAMYLDEKEHVQWTGLSEYCDAEKAQEWRDQYREFSPEPMRELLDRFVAAKLAYKANRKPEDPLSVGLAEARAAFMNPDKN